MLIPGYIIHEYRFNYELKQLVLSEQNIKFTKSLIYSYNEF